MWPRPLCVSTRIGRIIRRIKADALASPNRSKRPTNRVNLCQEILEKYMKPTREFPDSAPYENTEAVLAVEQRVKQALKSGAAVAIDDSRQLVEALRRARVTIENYRARENELLQRLEREPRFEVPEAAASRGLGATDAITEWAGDEKPGYAPEHKHSSLPPENEQKPEDGPSQEGEYFRAVRQRTRLSMALVPVQPEEESVQLEPLPVVDDREPPERDLPAEEP